MLAEEEEKLRALLRAIRDKCNIEGGAGGINELYFGEGLDIRGIEKDECRALFPILKELGLVEGDLRGSALFEKEGVLRLSSVRLTPKGVKTLKENLQILPPPRPATPAAQIINIGSINNAHDIAAGNNNTIRQTFNHPKQKAKAKGLLKHPFFVAAAAAVIGAIAAYLLPHLVTYLPK